MKPVIRKPWERVRAPITEYGESMTDRSHGNDTDVNNIVERFSRTGTLPPNNGAGQFCDVTNLQGDLTDLINQTKDAQQQLKQLQSEQKQAQEEKWANEQKELQELRQKVQELGNQDQPAPS